MRDLVWSIDSRRDHMHHLLDRMRELAEEAFSLAQKDFEFKRENLPLEQKLAVATRQHLYLIFREAITNCCMHSNGDYVKISFSRQAGQLELRIHDNGTSSSTPPSSSGLGLDNMKRRATALNGELIIDNKDGFLVLLKV